MKSNVVRIICLAVLASLFAALLASCGSSGRNSEVSGSGDAAPYVNPLKGYEKIPVMDIKKELNDGKLDLREYKFLKTNLFTSGDKTYDWFAFYNACVSGEIKLTDPEAASYASDSFDTFEEFGLTGFKEQANTILDAVKGLAG